jgi:hypothetical protein
LHSRGVGSNGFALVDCGEIKHQLNIVFSVSPKKISFPLDFKDDPRALILPNEFVCLPKEGKISYQENRSNAHKEDIAKRGPEHKSRIALDGLGRLVHAPLGLKVLLLQLSFYGFFALAGRGFFIVFDDSNWDRERKRRGWSYLACGCTLGLACFGGLILLALSETG